MSRIWFHRVGSDPELLFAITREFRADIIPASKIISQNKAKAITTFIGTDNHPATAEIRPTPAHNIKRHLYDIASALNTITGYLQSRKLDNVVMLARPLVNHEPLGAHIHASFFVDEPDTELVLYKYNLIYGVDATLVPFDKNDGAAMVRPEDVWRVERYCRDAFAEKLVTPWVFYTVMDHLIAPLEYWVQPWFERAARNHKYGLGLSDIVRYGMRTRPNNRERFSNFAYLHYEYRGPSSWLVHPMLAYAYLALAKLALVNWKLIFKLVPDAPRGPNPTDSPANEEYHQILLWRLKALAAAGGIFTKDTAHLNRALAICEAERERWFGNPVNPIDIGAWRRLL